MTARIVIVELVHAPRVVITRIVPPDVTPDPFITEAGDALISEAGDVLTTEF